MARYIDCDKCYHGRVCAYRHQYHDMIVDCNHYKPTADVEEVKHGEWNECFEDWRKQIVGDECSVCGFQHYGTCLSDYNYCPNCGAKMDGGKEDV